MAYFDGIRVGDRVYDMRWGWGTVCGTNELLIVTFDAADTDNGMGLSFGYDGKFCPKDNQTLFWSKPKFTPPPRLKRKAKKKIERWVNVYPSGRVTCAFNTVCDANEYDLICGGRRRIACVKLTGEYEVEE